MKCPACWSEKVYFRIAKGWKAKLLLACGLTAPMRCHHCYHRFWVLWILTLGKQLQAPEKKMSVETPRISYAARYLREQQTRRDAGDSHQDPQHERRAAA